MKVMLFYVIKVERIVMQKKTYEMNLVDRLDMSLIAWYDVEPSNEILLLGKAIRYRDFFSGKSCNVCCASLCEICEETFQKKNNATFDIILGLEILETEPEPKMLLDMIKALMKKEGKLFLGADNRLGVRYLCGEKDPFTQRCFDGLDKYISLCSEKKDFIQSGRCYTKAELKSILTEVGLNIKFYAVLPTLENAQLIVAEDYVIAEKISARYFPMYRNPDTVFLREEQIYDDFVQNGALHTVANAFLIECTLNNCFTDIRQVTLSMNRGEERAWATIMRSKQVEKRILFSKGYKSLQKLDQNMRALYKKGIPTVPGQCEGQAYMMPYIDAPLGNIYLQQLLRTDADEFLKCMDQFRELILKSSEPIAKNEHGIILKDGYVDMIPLNSFFQNGEFVFFDQEFCINNYPANAILYRAIIVVYEQMPEHEALIPMDLVWQRYGLKEQLEYLNKITTEFLVELRNYRKLTTFYDTHMRNEWITNYNRKRLDDVVNNVVFYDDVQGNKCFEGLKDKKVFLFGAGRWCDKFLAFYKNDYNICRILDNDESKWGTQMNGIPVASPESLVGEQDAYKVIICAKNYEPIYRQLKRMQVVYIGIYDANYIYAGRQTLNIVCSDEKKYHIGYLSGTFDVFHIGHVNILRRAKEQCDYLIVAVTSDEYVRNHKNKEPIIPFEERVQVLDSCKYVDEVVGVPVNYAGTIEAFQKYHFDCQFCGSDCKYDPWWLEQKEFLQNHDSDLCFLPYTEQTSSTKIRALIDNELM